MVAAQNQMPLVSGSTEPWYPDTRIRDHLMQQAPEAPKGLIACFTPQQDFRALR